MRLIVCFYNGFLLLTAGLAVSSLGVTIFALSQANRLDGFASTGIALLTSTATTAIVAVAITTVLQFTFRSVEAQYERLDLIASWVPLFVSEVIVLEVLAGVLLWYTGNSPNELAISLASVLLVSLITMALLALWVRRNIRMLVEKIRLNIDEGVVQDWEGEPNITYTDGYAHAVG